MPGLDTIRNDERCQNEIENRIGNLSNDELCFTTGAVRQRPRNDAKKEKRNAAHGGGKANCRGELVIW